jgi:N-methylhydantoinase B/oxoprolinase/acetone carboxylase alpha subunit
MTNHLDGIALEIQWSNLIATVTEQARALQRIAFSPIVREAGDLATALFDRRGRMVAQAVTGTPGHINSLGAAGQHFVRAFPPDTLSPGDVLITNDPWLSAGHFFDITIMTPVFRGAHCIGFFGSTIHHTDIGGYGVGAGARDVHEEGLWIPLAKLYEKGEANRLLFDIIRRNVRTPDHVAGDLAAQVAAGRVGAERLNALCERSGFEDIEALSDAIIGRSEEATRESIRKLTPGTFQGESIFDVPGGLKITLKAAVTIDTQAGEMVIDFTGSSPEAPIGINVVLNYTAAYANFAVRACLDPDLPNNFGSLTPVKVVAPEGSIVNPSRPAPVWARHLTGHYVPLVLFRALAPILPARAMADSAAPIWTAYFKGSDAAGAPFVKMYFMSGGLGAREGADGFDCRSFPSNIANSPVETFESLLPLLIREKTLLPGSAGAGRFRGGLGQRITFESVSDTPIAMTIRHERVRNPPRGMLGGGNGAPGSNQVNAREIEPKSTTWLRRGDRVTFRTPGGGGIGDPAERAPDLAARDRRRGILAAG